MNPTVLISLASADDTWEVSSRYVEQAFIMAGETVRMAGNLRADEFRLGTGGNSRLEDCKIVAHYAHGKKDFFEAWGDVNDRHVFTNDLAPGRGALRYLLLISCNVLEHGSDSGRFPDKGLQSNAFERWGRRDPQTNRGPLEHGVRMVLGGSTLIYPGGPALYPIFRVLRLGGMLADSFILGLVSDCQTPLCAAMARVDDNPLFDAEWSSRANPTGSHIFLQYPSRSGSGDSIGTKFGMSVSIWTPHALPGGYEPASLPEIEVAEDSVTAGRFRALASNSGGNFLFRYVEGENALLITSQRAVSEGHPEFKDLLAVVGAAIRRPALSQNSNILDLMPNTTTVLLHQLASYPVLDLQSPGGFDPGLITESVKSIHVFGRLQFQDLRNPAALYDGVDPDLSAILRYSPRDMEVESDLPPFSLMVRAFKFQVRSQGRILLSLEAAWRTAEAKAAEMNSISQKTDIDDSEVGRLARRTITVVYRLHRGLVTDEHIYGLLTPYYRCSFFTIGGAGELIEVDVPAIAQG